MAVKIYGGCAPTKFDIRQDSRELSIELTIENLRRLEEDTGEKFIDENGNPIPYEKKDSDKNKEKDDDWSPL